GDFLFALVKIQLAHLVHQVLLQRAGLRDHVFIVWMFFVARRFARRRGRGWRRFLVTLHGVPVELGIAVFIAWRLVDEVAGFRQALVDRLFLGALLLAFCLRNLLSAFADTFLEARILGQLRGDKLLKLHA